LSGDQETVAAVDLVTEFLRFMEERDLDAASRCLAPDADIVFPGDRRFGDLGALVESAGKRYRKVTKTIELVESWSDDAETVVYVIGRLSGVSASGVDFKDVRFIDRLVVRKGLIANHQVWNDLAETGVILNQEWPAESPS
jgi:ketosteroid isomerase-like protein